MLSIETMPTLKQLIEDPDVIVSIETEELAFAILQTLESKNECLNNYINTSVLLYNPTGGNLLANAIAEAWSWLESQNLLIHDPTQNGNHGWRIKSRKAQQLDNKNKFDKYRQELLFPKSIIHSSIQDKVWLSFLKGEYDTAVFQSFKEVEVAVRNAAKLSNDDFGIKLVRKAFNPKDGVLTNQEQGEGEKQALSDLFAGAIGSYKNPHSHRSVQLTDPIEAMEMIMLASHLLRIVDSRKAIK